MEAVIHELNNLGFSKKEAAIYAAALSLGPATIQDIARRAGVNRATTYVIIEAFIKKGLVSTFLKGKKKCFSLESPDRLLSLIHLQKSELEEREKEFLLVLPKFFAVYNSEGVRPQIRYLEGVEGIASLMNLFEETPGEFIEFVSIEDVERVRGFFQYRVKHLDNLRQKGVNYRLLAVLKDLDFSKIPFVSGGEVRLLSSEKFPLRGDISVRGNTVFMYSFLESMIGVVITSADFANTMRQLLNLAWEGAVSYPSEKR